MQRAKVLLILIDVVRSEASTQLSTLLKELEGFSKKLYNKKYAIVLSKTDLIDDLQRKEKLKELELYTRNIEKKPEFISYISSITNENVKELKYKLQDIIKN